MRSATLLAQKRAARKAAGYCTECDTPRVMGHSLCRRHLEMQRARMEAYNAKRIDANRCYCGARMAPGKNRCKECLEIEREKGRIRMAQLKAANKCLSCGKHRARPGKVHCLRCAVRAREYYLNRKERQQLRLARRGQLASRLFETHAYSVGAVRA